MISVSLNGAEQIKAEIESLTKSKDKLDKACKKLAEIGQNVAQDGFSNAYYQGVNDGQVVVNEIQDGYEIAAGGESVPFIEFGAGVHFNGQEPYPLPRPSGIVNIGEYGKGKGKQNTWGYYDKNGDLQITHGTIAQMPMYHAVKEIEKNLDKVVKEVMK